MNILLARSSPRSGIWAPWRSGGARIVVVVSVLLVVLALLGPRDSKLAQVVPLMRGIREALSGKHPEDMTYSTEI